MYSDQQWKLNNISLSPQKESNYGIWKFKSLPKFLMIAPEHVRSNERLSNGELELAKIVSDDLGHITTRTEETPHVLSSEGETLLNTVKDTLTEKKNGIEERTRKLYRQEFESGLEKMQESEKLVPKECQGSDATKYHNALLNDISETETTLENIKSNVKKKYEENATNLSKLIKNKIGRTLYGASLDAWAASFLLQQRRANIKDQANKWKHLELPDGQSLRFSSEEDLRNFLYSCRELMLAKAILDKTNSAIANAKEVKNLQDGLKTTLQNSTQQENLSAKENELKAAWKKFNEDVESVQKIFRSNRYDLENRFSLMTRFRFQVLSIVKSISKSIRLMPLANWADRKMNILIPKHAIGEYLNNISEGITSDEVLAFTAISGMLPRPAQASLLNKLFKGDISAFQLIMGGGKTAIMLSMMAFFTSVQADDNAPVPCIVAHCSQFESLKGTIGHEYQERFGRKVYTLTVDFQTLNDITFIRHLNRDLQEVKEKRQLILIPGNDMNKIHLTYTKILEVYNFLEKQKAEQNAILDNVKSQLAEQTALLEQSPNNEKITNSIAQLNDSLKIEENKLRIIEDEISAFDKKNGELLFELNKTLTFFRKDVTALIDEADSVLKSTDEVNFPQGKEEVLNQTVIDASIRLATLMSKPEGDENRSLFRLASNEQDTLTTEEFVQDVRVLAKRMLGMKFPAQKQITLREWLINKGLDEENLETQFIEYLIHNVDSSNGATLDSDARTNSNMSDSETMLPAEQQKDVRQASPFEKLFKEGKIILGRSLCNLITDLAFLFSLDNTLTRCPKNESWEILLFVSKCSDSMVAIRK